MKTKNRHYEVWRVVVFVVVKRNTETTILRLILHVNYSEVVVSCEM